MMGDDNIVTATDFGHPEGRNYAGAAQELLGLPGVSTHSKRKIMWDNTLRMYPLEARVNKRSTALPSSISREEGI